MKSVLWDVLRRRVSFNNQIERVLYLEHIPTAIVQNSRYIIIVTEKVVRLVDRRRTDGVYCMRQILHISNHICSTAMKSTDTVYLAIVEYKLVNVVVVSGKRVRIYRKHYTYKYSSKCLLHIVHYDDNDVRLHLSFDVNNPPMVFRVKQHSGDIETINIMTGCTGLFYPVYNCYLNVQYDKLVLTNKDFRVLTSRKNINCIAKVVQIDYHNFLGFNSQQIYLLDLYTFRHQLVYKMDDISDVFFHNSYIFMYQGQYRLIYIHTSGFGGRDYSNCSLDAAKRFARPYLSENALLLQTRQASQLVNEIVRSCQQRFQLASYESELLVKWMYKMIYEERNLSKTNVARHASGTSYSYLQSQSTAQELGGIASVAMVCPPFIVTEESSCYYVWRITG